jgi:sec-independent protein translocase protein TatB
MFDIGFAELVIIAVVGLLVIGPERLPGTIRTASLWLNRLRRSFNDIKREIEQDLHNDGVMQDLKRTRADLQDQTRAISDSISEIKSDIEKAAGGADDSAGQSQPTGRDEPRE